MENTLRRAVEGRLAPGLGVPVAILEGARGVGKTTVARHLQASGAFASYVSLGDDAEREAAAANPEAWLSSLARPAIIDEAQLVPQLPLSIKKAVDDSLMKDRFLLTGSAAIGRRGLGGADPLTGRAIRYRLEPFTQAELAGQPDATATLVERMFQGPRHRQRFPRLSLAELRERLTSGGMPALALSGVAAGLRSDFLDSYLVSALSDDVLPDERYDYFSARAVLDAVLANPGGILNQAQLGTRLGIDPRTVGRYLDVLERRFLIQHLPNLATNEHRQGRARSKLHPLDCSFAADRLAAAGRGIGESQESLGRVLESYVAAQVIAAASAGSSRVRCFYWRDSKTELEVDLVVVDEAGRAVGIEVKATSSVTAHDLRGLRELASRRQLEAGYVVYTGEAVLPLGERLWALPLTALDAPSFAEGAPE